MSLNIVSTPPYLAPLYVCTHLHSLTHTYAHTYSHTYSHTQTHAPTTPLSLPPLLSPITLLHRRHQPFGLTSAACHEEEMDLQGWKRAKYLCPEHMAGGESASTTAVFQMEHCNAAPSAVHPPTKDSKTWYTICGRRSSSAWRFASAALVVASAFLHFAVLFAPLTLAVEGRVDGKTPKAHTS